MSSRSLLPQGTHVQKYITTSGLGHVFYLNASSSLKPSFSHIESTVQSLQSCLETCVLPMLPQVGPEAIGAIDTVLLTRYFPTLRKPTVDGGGTTAVSGGTPRMVSSEVIRQFHSLDRELSVTFWDEVSHQPLCAIRMHGPNMLPNRRTPSISFNSSSLDTMTPLHCPENNDTAPPMWCDVTNQYMQRLPPINDLYVFRSIDKFCFSLAQQYRFPPKPCSGFQLCAAKYRWHQKPKEILRNTPFAIVGKNPVLHVPAYRGAPWEAIIGFPKFLVPTPVFAQQITIATKKSPSSSSSPSWEIVLEGTFHYCPEML
eukprot:PhF_6_TR13000/c0_g1_i3/m.20580